MEKLFLLLLGISLIVFPLSAQKRVIENPLVEEANTDFLDIRKIDVSKSATILWIDSYGYPGDEISVASNTVLKSPASGKEYKLIGAEGIKPDQKIAIPERGYCSFRLTFEPLEKGETSIDYIGTNEWILRNIHLYKEKKERRAFRCLVKGEVIGCPNSSRLILIKAGGDIRGTKEYIPIRDGKFEYSLGCDDPEAYELIFEDEFLRGSFGRTVFFAEPGVVKMVLHNREERYKDVVTGGKENKTYLEFRKLKDELFSYSKFNKQRETLKNEGKYYNEKEKELSHEMDLALDDHQKYNSLMVIYQRLELADSFYTPEALAFENEYLEWIKKKREWEMEYYRAHPSPVTYYFLKDDFGTYLRSLQHNASRFQAEYYMNKDSVLKLVDSVYRPLFPSHPYTLQMDNYFIFANRVREGGHFIDFTAPGLFDDVPAKLSEKIAGKIALIDLWASWCGGCRINAKSMIPVYEKYKDRGFTVVGITRERNKQDGANAARKDKYPWLNLLELNDSGKIWEKYGVGSAGGGTFLVDRDGTILQVNPTAEEVARILEEKLK